MSNDWRSTGSLGTPDVFNVTSGQADAAQAELFRVEAEWRKYQFEQITGDMLAQQAEKVRQLSEEVSQTRSQITNVLREKQRSQVQIRRLHRLKLLMEIWQSPSKMRVVGVSALVLSVLIALCVGFMVWLPLGFLVGFVLICLMALFGVFWSISSEEWAEQQTTTLAASLHIAEGAVIEAEGRSNHAEALSQRTLQDWQGAVEAQKKMVFLHYLWQSYSQAFSRNACLQQLIQSQQYRLLHCNWRAMRGTEFEMFLQQIFEEQGYSVETTKASGDQGLDLILTKVGRRIGVQAKGYDGNVGNSAVQEAFTGMSYYSCTSCVVITNSDFTRQARDVAKKVNCGLIGGSNLPDLILGKISL